MAIFKYITENGTGIDLKQVEADLSGNESNKEEIEDATVKTDAGVDVKKVEEDLSGNESNKEEIEDATTKTDDGVDPKQVEDDLSDNASNEEEIEAADEGLVGDPVEEAFYIMYESTYNMNELMKAIGVAELKEAYNGKELVLEAVDFKAFWERIGEMLERLLANIQKIVADVMAKVKNTSKSDKKFWLENQKEIANGLVNPEFSYNGFKFADIKFPEANTLKARADKYWNEYESDRNKALEDIKSGNTEAGNGYGAEDLEAKKKDILVAYYKDYGITDINGEHDLKDLTRRMSIVFRGGTEPKELKGTISADDIKKELFEGDKTWQTMMSDWAAVKNIYLDNIKLVKGSAKQFDKGNENKLFVIASFYSKLIVYDKNVTNAVIGTVLREAVAKRNQARRIAQIAIRHNNIVKKASATDEDGNTLKAEIIESAQTSNAFANIKIV